MGSSTGIVAAKTFALKVELTATGLLIERNSSDSLSAGKGDMSIKLRVGINSYYNMKIH